MSYIINFIHGIMHLKWICPLDGCMFGCPTETLSQCSNDADQSGVFSGVCHLLAPPRPGWNLEGGGTKNNT